MVYDLYDLLIDHLQKKNFMEKCYAQEERRGIKKVQDAIVCQCTYSFILSGYIY